MSGIVLVNLQFCDGYPQFFLTRWWTPLETNLAMYKYIGGITNHGVPLMLHKCRQWALSPWCKMPLTLLSPGWAEKNCATVPCDGRSGSGKLFMHGSSSKRRHLGSSIFLEICHQAWLAVLVEPNGGLSMATFDDLRVYVGILGFWWMVIRYCHFPTVLEQEMVKPSQMIPVLEWYRLQSNRVLQVLLQKRLCEERQSSAYLDSRFDRPTFCVGLVSGFVWSSILFHFSQVNI